MRISSAEVDQFNLNYNYQIAQPPRINHLLINLSIKTHFDLIKNQ